MPTGLRVDVGTRPRVLVSFLGVALTVFLLAAAAQAAISPFDPWEGTVAPGESVTATFTVVDSFTSCFTVDSPPGVSATLGGLGLHSLSANCAVSGTRVSMRVTANSDVSPGNYTVTISETALSGQLLDTHVWPVTVFEPASPPTTTTTTSTTTTTTKPPSTTSTSSTTIPSLTTTTTSTAADVVTGTTPPTASSPRTHHAAPGIASTASPAPSETEAHAGTIVPADSTVRNGPEVLASGPERQDLPDDPDTRPPGEEEPRPLSQTPLSDRLGVQIPPALPPYIIDAALSPIVIGEYILHSVLDSSKQLLIPIAIGTLIGLLMVWRMRTEIAGDELELSRFSLD